MTERALIVRIPVSDVASTWTDDDLQGNVALYLDLIIGQAERRNEAEFGKPAYRLGEVTVWTEEAFAADLNSLDPTRHCFREDNCSQHPDHEGPNCCCCGQPADAHSGCDCKEEVTPE